MESFALDFQLLQQAVVDIALAGLLGDKIPEVTDFRLADPVNAAEPLLQAVGIPGQIVIDHQVGVLEVDAFSRGVGSYQNADIGIGAEKRLEAAALVAVGAAMDRDNRVGVAKDPGDAPL